METSHKRTKDVTIRNRAFDDSLGSAQNQKDVIDLDSKKEFNSISI